jgi:hypothetical protein
VAASNQLLSPYYHLIQEINQVNQFMILFIVPGVTVGLSILNSGVKKSWTTSLAQG